MVRRIGVQVDKDVRYTNGSGLLEDGLGAD